MKIIIITISLTVLYLISQGQTVIDQQYIVLKKIQNVEIRDYQASLNASYYSESDLKRNNYFRYLASYIFGGNSENTEISMTSPVTMRLYGNREMIFRMPEKYSLDNLPMPNNPEINLITISACRKAAIRYSGYSNDSIEKKKINELKELLLRNNIPHTDKFEVLVYDSPFKILNRRNEITVNITYP